MRVAAVYCGAPLPFDRVSPRPTGIRRPGFFISGDNMPQEHISQKRAVYTIAGMERATIARDIAYRSTETGPLTLDVYYPADRVDGSFLPGVIIVAGYSDAGAEKVFGC